MNSSQNFWDNFLKKWTVLDPPDRLSEVLFGLIMVLTFVGTISASTSGHQDIDQLIWAALGCNFAWGLVDAIMNTMDTLIIRSKSFSEFDKIKSAKSLETSRNIVRDNVSPLVSELMDDRELDQISEKIKRLPEPTKKSLLTSKDLLIEFQIFLLVFLSTFPVVMPLLLIEDVNVAIRISNLIALILMFASGFALAKYSGLRPFITALAYTAIGISLVAFTMVLGG